MNTEANWGVGRSRSVLAIFAVLGVFALTAGTAVAQDSSVQGYGGVGGDTQDDLGGVVADGIGPRNGGGPEDVGPAGGGPEDVGPAGAEAGGTGDADSGSLPFTGLDLALLIGGGVLLVAAGATLAAANRRRSADTA